MSGDSEIRKPIQKLRRRASTKGKLVQNAIPTMIFTAAVSQDDLCTLPSRSLSAERRPQTSDGPKIRKRIHIADLLVEQTPRQPTFTPAHMQNPSPYSETIGLAIGSPMNWQIPNSSSNRPSPEISMPATFPASTIPSTAQIFDVEQANNSNPKRNLFSSIFGKKTASDTRRTLHKSPPPISPKTTVMIEHRQVFDGSPNQENRPIIPPTTPGLKQVTSRPSVGQLFRKPSLGFKQKINRSATSPVNLPVVSRDFLTKNRPQPPPKDFPRRVSESTTNQISSPHLLPHLTVNIPDITMERYSVMFSDVLKPKQSLLARRQSNLRYLQMDGQSKSNVTIHKLESLPVRRATAPTPRSPRLSLFPTLPLTSDTLASQRAGLSRSNTLPSPIQQKFSETLFSKRKESHLDEMRSPSHGSETPISAQSDWQSEGSIDISELSDGTCDDDNDETSNNIMIQLEDLALPQILPTHPLRSSVSTSMRSSASIPLIYQPNLNMDDLALPQILPTHPLRSSVSTSMRSSASIPLIYQPNLNINHQQNITEETEHSTRNASLLQSSYVLPSSMLRSKETSVLAVVNDRSQSIPNIQQPINKPMQRFNPLQSSPATPTEITIARQLSLSRSRTTIVPITKTARQPQLTTIVKSDSFPEPKGWKFSVPSHMRNNSHHVVLESV